MRDAAHQQRNSGALHQTRHVLAVNHCGLAALKQTAVQRDVLVIRLHHPRLRLSRPPEGIPIGPKEPKGDQFLIRVQGAQDGPSFEVWIRPDASRAPVAVKIPFSLGTFSAELQ